MVARVARLQPVPTDREVHAEVTRRLWRWACRARLGPNRRRSPYRRRYADRDRFSSERIGMSEAPEDRRERKAIRKEWEAAGRPPCPVCSASFGSEDASRVSLLWRAVVHALCVRAKVVRPSRAQMALDPCPWFPDCPAPYRRGSHESCVSPCIGHQHLSPSAVGSTLGCGGNAETPRSLQAPARENNGPRSREAHRSC